VISNIHPIIKYARQFDCAHEEMGSIPSGRSGAPRFDPASKAVSQAGSFDEGKTHIILL
jgi:hypothetical protein